MLPAVDACSDDLGIIRILAVVLLCDGFIRNVDVIFLIFHNINAELRDSHFNIQKVAFVKNIYVAELIDAGQFRQGQIVILRNRGGGIARFYSVKDSVLFRTGQKALHLFCGHNAVGGE